MMRKYKFEPYSRNVVFFDTEFSRMDPYRGEILSIGMMTYVVPYDAVYLHKLFGSMKTHPFHWVPVDFASILFGLGINPESYFPEDKDNFFKKIGIDPSKYKLHQALDDAKMLRAVYLKMTGLTN